MQLKPEHALVFASDVVIDALNRHFRVAEDKHDNVLVFKKQPAHVARRAVTFPLGGRATSLF
jgi:hypothetical protein